MPIAVRPEGDRWVVEYRRRVVAEAGSEAEAGRLARRAIERLLAKTN